MRRSAAEQKQSTVCEKKFVVFVLKEKQPTVFQKRPTDLLDSVGYSI